MGYLKMADSNKDATIRAQWSINAAIAFSTPALSKVKESSDALVQTNQEAIETVALEFFNMVDRIVEAGNEVEEAEASEASIKYLKSLIAQGSKKQLTYGDAERVILHDLGPKPTQTKVSEYIDELKGDKAKGIIDNMVTHIEDKNYAGNFDPPEKDPRDEVKE